MSHAVRSGFERRIMNICIVTGIFPPDIGGPATYVSRLAQALVEEGHSVSVVTLGDEASDSSFPVRRVSRRLPLPLRLLKLFFLLLREGRDADLWYINGLELPAVLAGKMLRKRLVMKVVGDYAWERAMNQALTRDLIDDFQMKPQPWKVELHKRLRAWLARRVDKLVTPSRYLKRIVQGWGVPESRIHVIYNAVEGWDETLEASSEVRQKFGVQAEECLLVTVGRLVSWKGIDGLIRLLPRLNASVKLLIVGEGPERNMLTKLAEDLSVSSRVAFAGKASRKHALSSMNAADIFVLNTAYEGFSHVLLEAMMLGLPVLTTSVCGNPELVTTEENGILVRLNHEEELLEQLERLLSEPALRNRLGLAGQNTAHSFAWSSLLDETTSLLKEAVWRTPV